MNYVVIETTEVGRPIAAYGPFVHQRMAEVFAEAWEQKTGHSCVILPLNQEL